MRVVCWVTYLDLLDAHNLFDPWWRRGLDRALRFSILWLVILYLWWKGVQLYLAPWLVLAQLVSILAFRWRCTFQLEPDGWRYTWLWGGTGAGAWSDVLTWKETPRAFHLAYRERLDLQPWWNRWWLLASRYPIERILQADRCYRQTVLPKGGLDAQSVEEVRSLLGQQVPDGGVGVKGWHSCGVLG